jgi:FixJ family two-component response regulator
MNDDVIVYLVDDDEMFRTALSRVLRSVGYSVQSYSSAGEFLLVEKKAATGCVLLDIRLPGPNGLDLYDAMLKQPEPLPVIFITGFGDVAMSVRAMKAGAVDFLTKPIDRKALLSAVAIAITRARQNHLRNDKLRRVRTCYDTLTEREREVFCGVVSGKLNKQIAADLGTAERTVKLHRSHLMEKMHVESVADLVRASELLSVRSGKCELLIALSRSPAPKGNSSCTK